MKRIILFLLMAIACVITATAQKNQRMKYDEQWKKIDELKNERLPVSTLEEIQKLYQIALKEQEYGQVIKAIMYRMSCQADTQENAVTALLDSLQNDLKVVPQPAKSIVYWLIADIYKGYYNANRWQIINRTQTNINNNDIETWDVNKLYTEAIKYYNLSLQDEKILQSTPLEDYEILVARTGEVAENEMFYPTLYDFLVFVTSETLKSDIGVARPQETFVLNKPEYFADARTFSNYKITTSDTLSIYYQTIALYQKITKFRLQQVDKAIVDKMVNRSTSENDLIAALVNWDIMRLKYVKDNGRYNDNEVLYEKALKGLQKDFDKYPDAIYATYWLADLYNSQGGKWRSEKNDKYRFKYREAYELCSQIIKQTPTNNISNYAEKLQKQIKNQSVSLTLNTNQSPNNPILALANYQNINSVTINIFQVTEKYYIDNNRYSFGVDDFDDKKPFKTQTINLPVTTDFQPYSAEIKIDALPQGLYAIIVSSKDNNSTSGSLLQVSPFTTVERSYETKEEKDEAELIILNSLTGKPINKAKVEIYINTKNKNNKGYTSQLDGTYYTNDKGIAKIKDWHETSYNVNFHKAIITSGNDRLVLKDLGMNSYGYSEDKDNKAVFFTDRSIYRPGQTVYFKALLFSTNNDGNNKLLPKTKLNVTFKDVNYKDIATQYLTTNEFGSVQGSFTAPQGLLNGTMSIICEHGSTYIQVEEYKRPTFEVKFDPVKQTYQLNSQIKVTGNAKALAGYAVDNSKVQYRITRNTRYRTYRWWFPPIQTPPREVASGEVKTDSKGMFTIDFKANADDIKNDDLVYDYIINADVTDVNGETRSTSLTLPVSKKPLLINWNIPTRIINREKLTFPLLTTNLNGDLVSSDIEIKITALKSPNKILNSRLWGEPDTFSLSREEFEKHFPNDPYGDEDNVEKYIDLKEIKSYKTSVVENATHIEKPLSGNSPTYDMLENQIENNQINLYSLIRCKPGWYRVSVKAKNADGIEVEDEKIIQLMGNTSVNDTKNTPSILTNPAPIQNMNEWLTTIRNSGEPGESAEFWVAGANEKSYIYYEVLFKNTIIEQKSIIVGSTPQKIIIPINEEYRGGFAVQFVMVQNNHKYTNMCEVNVPYTNKMLDVTFNTFRDKLLPGEPEKWSLSVKNKQGEKEMAEMVATLYDASLDAFRPHNWNNFNSFYTTRNHYNYRWDRDYYAKTITTQNNDYRAYYAPTYQAPSVQFKYFGDYSSAFYKGSMYGYLQLESSGIRIRGTSSVTESAQPMMAQNGIPGAAVKNISRNAKVTILKDTSSTAIYGSRAAGGVIIIEDGDGGAEQAPVLTEVATRQNFNETAFFYPQLRTDENGEIIIEFTIPEALTRWKMLGFAHTKDLKIGSVTNELITQKQVAISANAPRFFREKDLIDFTAKVNNITEGDLNGQAMLRLYDATNMQPIDAQVIQSAQTQSFSVKAGESTGLKWTLAIPAGIQAITYKVTAQAGSHTDGEEKIVPVMANSMLVTETMPFSVRANQEKTFTLSKLKDNKSTTLRNHKLTLEFTSNPAWYAVQAMPYLMEYPYECAEQVFSRFYANSLAATIANSSPRIKQVFELWRNIPDNKDALLSNLEKNQELKQVMLEETPWVMQANNETERKKRVGLLFDLNRMSGEQLRAFDKVKKAQQPDGGFAWFSGLPANQYMTQHIITGFEHLKKLNALNTDFINEVSTITQTGLIYLDNCIKKDYDNLLKTKNIDLDKQHVSSIQLHYLYACSFSNHKPTDEKQLQAFKYYYRQAQKYWMNFSTYNQALIALATNRFGDKETALKIMKSLTERAQQSEEMGMYWKDNVAGYFWYQAPIETQALLIEAFNEVTNDTKAVEEMKIWLLRNKQTNDWKTTKATAEACYALLMTGTNLLDEGQILDVKIGGKPLAEAAKEDIRPEPGTGYVKTAWNSGDIAKNMAVVNVKNLNKSGVAWGGMYWQYFEQLDKITSAETNLKMNKQLFLKKITEKGAVLEPLNEKNVLKVGDVVKVRMELRADRDYEYVHLKDMRAAGFEPISTLSGHRYQDGLWYYESIKDASTNFFITYLRKGTYVFEYELRVTHAGNFSNGITTFQCMYAPEFSAHSEGIRVTIE